MGLVDYLVLGVRTKIDFGIHMGFGNFDLVQGLCTPSHDFVGHEGNFTNAIPS